MIRCRSKRFVRRHRVAKVTTANNCQQVTSSFVRFAAVAEVRGTAVSELPGLGQRLTVMRPPPPDEHLIVEEHRLP